MPVDSMSLAIFASGNTFTADCVVLMHEYLSLPQVSPAQFSS